jgi:aminotransferase
MHMKIAERFSQIPSSAIRVMVDRAYQMEMEGVRIAHFELGRPDFDTPAVIKAATKMALDRGDVHYGPNAGIPVLRKAVARYMSERRGVTWDADQILMTNGSIEALYLSLMTVVEPGDEVLIPEPCWTPYPAVVRLIGAVPRLIPLQVDNGFRLDVGALHRAVTPRTKALFLNSPHNPTGAIFDLSTLERVAELARRHDLLVVSDEVYEQICFDGQTAPTISALPGMQELTAVVSGFSKTFSMTGWRIGYVALPRPLVRPALLTHTNVNTSINTFIQYGALAAIESAGPDVARMSAEYQKRRDEAVRCLQAMPNVTLTPGGGSFFLFPRFNGYSDDQQLALILLQEAHVATVPGSAFGPTGAGHLRLSFSCDMESIAEGLERLNRWLMARA